MAALRILVRSDGREEEFIHEAGPIEIGRGRERDVPRFVVTDPTVSRDHLRMTLRPDGWLVVENLSSSTEIFHDRGPGVLCGQQQLVPLPVVLGLGDTDVVVSLAETPAAASAEAMIGETHTLRERLVPVEPEAPPAAEPEPAPAPEPASVAAPAEPAAPPAMSPFRAGLRLLFSPAVADALGDVAAPLAPQERDATLMLAELSGHAVLAARDGAERAFERLGALADLVAGAVEETGGSLLEATGGSFLAIWNAPAETPDHALNACLSARQIAAAVPPLLASWDAPHVRLGIGLRSGSFALGRTGGSRRLRYGPLAGLDLVRGQAAAARNLGLAILVDQTMRDRVPADLPLRRLGAVEMPGAGVEELYELAPAGEADEWQLRAEAFERALALYEHRQFGAAARALGELIAAGAAGDLATAALLARALEADANPPVGVAAVFTFRSGQAP